MARLEYCRKDHEQINFTRKLIDLRREFPILRRTRFLTGSYNEELAVSDVSWISASGAAMQEQDWKDSNLRCFGMLMDGRAQPTGIRTHGRDSTLLMVLNSYHDVVTFTLPKSPEGLNWLLLCDTNRPNAEHRDEFQFATEYAVTGRSLLLFLLKQSSANSKRNLISSRRTLGVVSAS